MSHRHTPSVPPTFSPTDEVKGDWTETACLVLVAIGTGYFTGHLIVAGVRAALS